MKGLDALFLAVCANDGQTSSRELEPVLGRVGRAILDGWDPSPECLGGVARRRAGYLLDVLRTWMPDARALAWTLRLDALRATDTESHQPTGFWHADRQITGRDDLARRWGLTRGLELGRLRYMLNAHWADR